METKSLAEFVKIRVNGQDRELTWSGKISLQETLEALSIQGEHFAVAVNLQFVPRRKYPETPIQENDSLEILYPMQGG